MKSYKAPKTWKDLIDKPLHHSLSRRDLIARGMVTGAVTVGLSKLLFGDVVKTAMAAGSTSQCPPPTLSAGAIGQIFASGGPTMGARFISEAQAGAMNTTMASNYGISGAANLMKLGPNMVIDKTSPFGFTLLQGPPGYPGGPTAWQTNVLKKISGGGHLGPFNQDDGAGQNTGLIGSVSPFKNSKMGKDLSIGTSGTTVASWSNGAPTATVSGGSSLKPASLANTFSMVPAATGLTSQNAMNAAADGANALAQAMDPVFNNSKRKFAQQFVQNAGCAFYGNSALANPTYGAMLFDPTNISALTANVTVSSLTPQEQALIAAYYQSAVGVAGGVLTEYGGRDYHGQSPQTSIAPADIEEARAIVMFLAACDAAKAPGAMIYLANGQAIAAGVQSVTATINGAAATLNAPVAKGDAGGAYNAGLIIFYDPKGSPPAAKFTGTVDNSNGNATVDSNIASSQQAVAGLYLSALQFVNGGTIPQLALNKIQSAGLAAIPSTVTVI
jgi:hypothetical protein